MRPEKPNPQLQRHMWFPRMTLIPIMVEDNREGSRYLMKAKPDLIRISAYRTTYHNLLSFIATCWTSR